MCLQIVFVGINSLLWCIVCRLYGNKWLRLAWSWFFAVCHKSQFYAVAEISVFISKLFLQLPAEMASHFANLKHVWSSVERNAIGRGKTIMCEIQWNRMWISPCAYTGSLQHSHASVMGRNTKLLVFHKEIPRSQINLRSYWTADHSRVRLFSNCSETRVVFFYMKTKSHFLITLSDSIGFIFANKDIPFHRNVRFPLSK